MSWNRRIAESKIFFDLMMAAGFHCQHMNKCIYRFTRGQPIVSLGTLTTGQAQTVHSDTAQAIEVSGAIGEVLAAMVGEGTETISDKAPLVQTSI